VSSIGFKDPRTQEGELLWASRFPKEWVDERNDELGKQIASAQLQQRPAPADGLIFADEMFPTADVTELAVKTGAEKVIVSIDCTFKAAANSDYVAMLVFVRFKGKWYLVDGVNERLDFVATLKTIKAIADKWMPHEFLVEDKANGTAIIRMMRDHFNNVTAICPTESKEARASAASAILLRGNVLFFKQQPVVDALIDQALQFPMGRHDDMVDALTQFVNKVLNVRQPSTDWLGFGGV
jgi:predicted phage terminase large subunit-like protein